MTVSNAQQVCSPEFLLGKRLQNPVTLALSTKRKDEKLRFRS